MANFNDSVANGVLSAIDLLTKKALSDLKFDKTYSPCTIIARSENDKNIYICEYENTRFEAYSDQSFFAGELVQVLVPQNNWDNQKRIVSRLMTGSSAAYDFKYPFDDFIPVSALEVEDLYTLLAGCTPVFISDLQALTGEVGTYLQKYHRYEQNLDKEYVWGVTPYEKDRQIAIIREEKMANVQNKLNQFIAFKTTNSVYECIHHEYLTFVRAFEEEFLEDNSHPSYYTLTELQNLVGKVGRMIQSDVLLTDGQREQYLSWLQEDNARLSAYYQSEYVKFADTNNLEDTDLYAIVENGSLNYIQNMAHQYAAINEFLTNLNTVWTNLNRVIFDWSQLNRDYTYSEMLNLIIQSNIPAERYNSIIESWMEYKANYFKERSFEEIYNEYRITPICGGPDVSYKFWANRKFYDPLTGHYSKFFTKLCTFVPMNGAATVEGFTKAGLQLEVESFLNQYKGLKGTYGVKIIVEGVKKTTADESSAKTYTASEYEREKTRLETQYQNDVTAIEEQYANDAYNKQLALARLDIRYDELWRKLNAHLIASGNTEYGVLDEEDNLIFDDEFTNAEFIGNSYAYTIPYSQQKLLNIEDYVSITKIILYAFQNYDSYDLSNTLIPGWQTDSNEQVVYKYIVPGVDATVVYARVNNTYDDILPDYEAELPANLILSKPYIGLGFALQELKDGKLILYTEEPLEYGIGGADINNEVETRTLKAVWVKANAEGEIHIYPSWELDPETREHIELQPTEKALFYTRGDEKLLNDLIEGYRLYYNTPFDATRADKQKIIIDTVNKWLNYERKAITLERQEIADKQASLNYEQDNITLAIEALNAKLISLENQLATVDSVADLSILNNITLYTQREIDEARAKLSDKFQELIKINPYQSALLTKENLENLRDKIVLYLMDLPNGKIFTEDIFNDGIKFFQQVFDPYIWPHHREIDMDHAIFAQLYKNLYSSYPNQIQFNIDSTNDNILVTVITEESWTDPSRVGILIRKILYCYYQIALQEKKLLEETTITSTVTDADTGETTQITKIKQYTSHDFYYYGKRQEQLAAELARRKANEYYQQQATRKFTFSAWEPAKVVRSWTNMYMSQRG